MDELRFDQFTRLLGSPMSRRGGLAGLVAGAVAGLTGADGAAQRFRANHCIPNGAICRDQRGGRVRHGSRHLHGCGKCCSKFSTRAGRVRRCECRPNGRRSRVRAHCCSRTIRNGRCAPVPVTAPLVEQGSGTLTSTSAPTCAATGGPCTDTIAGTVRGTPIDGTFTGSLTGTNFQPAGGTNFTADATGTVTATDTASGDSLTLSVSGELTGDGSGVPNAPWSFDGTYTITGGTGQFRGATGSGTATASGTDSGQTGTIASLLLDGTVTTGA